MSETIEKLIKTIKSKKGHDVQSSYTSFLLSKGNDHCLNKLKEEIGELIESVEQNTNKVHEAADVIYHLLVYFESNGIKIEDVMKELNKRKK